MPKYYLIRAIARYLRNNMTQAEKKLWPELRKKSLGFKFRRQAPICIGEEYFIADFYCPKLKLIIEVDGSIHDKKDIKNYDLYKQNLFKQNKFRILRFTNQQVFNNLNYVIYKIKQKIKALS